MPKQVQDAFDEYKEAKDFEHDYDIGDDNE